LDEEKGSNINKDPKAEKPIDKYPDLNIFENIFLKSFTHEGPSQ